MTTYAFINYGSPSHSRSYYTPTSANHIIMVPEEGEEGDGPRLEIVPKEYHGVIWRAERDGGLISPRMKTSLKGAIISMLITKAKYMDRLELERKILHRIVLATIQTSARRPGWQGRPVGVLVRQVMKQIKADEIKKWDFEDRYYHTYLLMKDIPQVDEVVWSDAERRYFILGV